MIRVCWMFLLLVVSTAVVSQPGDPDDIVCNYPVPFGNSGWHLLCRFPGQSIYVPNNVAWDYPVSFLVPYAPGPNTLRLRMLFGGYQPYPPFSCENLNSSEAGYITIKNCPGHYPNIEAHRVDDIDPLGWWGQFFGDSDGYRVAVSLAKASGLWSPSIDHMAGVMLKGQSYGGTGAILQSVVLPDPTWKSQIAIVWADIPHTLFVRPDPDPNNVNVQGGLYWHDAAVQLAWGSYDPANADIVQQSDSVRHVYYRVNGSPGDHGFDLEFFNKLCDQKKIACFGTWHNGGHAVAENGIDLPFYDLFSSPDMDVRLDQVLVAFTYSTANHFGPRGHFNLGLEWADGGAFVDTAEVVKVPIRYRRRTNIGGGVPDQPASATFNVTLRRVKNLSLPWKSEVAWVFGNQSGFAKIARKQEVTIEGLTLQSSDNYTELQITPHAPPPPGC